MTIKTIHEPKFYKAKLNVTRTYSVIVPGRTHGEATRNAIHLDPEALEDMHYEETRKVIGIQEA